MAYALVEKDLPILGRPTVIAPARQRHDARIMMTRQQVEQGGQRCGRRFKCEVVAIEHHRDAGYVRNAKGFGGAHSRALQPLVRRRRAAELAGDEIGELRTPRLHCP